MKLQNLLSLLGLGLVVCGSTLSAQASEMLGLGYQPKYPPGFSHFAYANPKAPKGGTLTLGGAGSFDKLNPFLLKGSAADGTDLLYDSLAVQSLDEPFSMYGLLAESMDLAADGLSVQFRLRPQARFADGSPLRADDVRFSFDTLTRDAASNPSFRFYYADVAQVQVLDPLTVRFRFKRRNPELHLILAAMKVFSQRLPVPWAQSSMQPPLGSGPYRLDKVDGGRSISYRRRPDYWAAHLPVRQGSFNFDQVRYRYYQDETVRLEAFKAGEFDVLEENVAKQWAKGYNIAAVRDGRIQKMLFAHENAAGMQGFGFNLRKPLFQDRRVRQALSLALDFEWMNRNLFYGQYRRGVSYYGQTDMEAHGLPDAAELALLEPWRAQLPAEVFGPAVTPPNMSEPTALRQNLRLAKALLEQAGWRYRDGVMQNARGEALRFELLLYSKTFERVAAPYVRNLAKIGVDLQIRVMDPANYEERLKRFDFDMVVHSFGQSQSPGNEQQEFFASAAADRPGSKNLLGLRHPAVDALVNQLIQSPDRAHLLVACRALDRVLRAEYLMVPHWFVPHHRVAYWNRLARPAQLPKYYQSMDWVLEFWWAQPAGRAVLSSSGPTS